MPSLLSLHWRRDGRALVLGDVASPGAVLTPAAPWPRSTSGATPYYVGCSVGCPLTIGLAGRGRLLVWLVRSELPVPSVADIDWLDGVASLPIGTARPSAGAP